MRLKLCFVAVGVAEPPAVDCGIAPVDETCCAALLVLTVVPTGVALRSSAGFAPVIGLAASVSPSDSSLFASHHPSSSPPRLFPFVPAFLNATHTLYVCELCDPLTIASKERT